MQAVLEVRERLQRRFSHVLAAEVARTVDEEHHEFDGHPIRDFVPVLIQREALPSVDDYLGLVMQFIFAFGVAFLLPILLMLLERAGLVTRDQLKRGRRYAILLAFVVAAFITPPDVWSQCMLAVPLVLLYEITLIAIWFTERRRARAIKSEATASE